jgi:hypothetical protein
LIHQDAIGCKLYASLRQYFVDRARNEESEH